MASGFFYRGGRSVAPRSGETRVDPTTGLLRTTHGISVYDRPEGLERFGGAYVVTNLPDSLQVVQRGRDPHHYEIAPAIPMTPEEYDEALREIVLVSV